MNFNDHSSLSGQHAFLSPSSYHWVRYSDDKLVERYTRSLAIERGTELHALAQQLILAKQKLPRSQKALNNYVNDAIGFRMSPEQGLYYSENAFGTVDAIAFRDKILRIHDLKTGFVKASPTQLEVYAALFCLEYNQKPENIKIELRIYQLNEIRVFHPDSKVIREIMDKIIHFDRIIEQVKSVEEELWLT